MDSQEQETPQPIKVAGIQIDVADQSPLVQMLLTVIQKQDAEIQLLKKTTTRPKIKPSRLHIGNKWFASIKAEFPASAVLARGALSAVRRGA